MLTTQRLKKITNHSNFQSSLVMNKSRLFLYSCIWSICFQICGYMILLMDYMCRHENEYSVGFSAQSLNYSTFLWACYVPTKVSVFILYLQGNKLELSLTKVLHFAIGKPMAHHGKFAVQRTAKATLANYCKLYRAKHRGKKRSPASHKRMANNGIFTFPSMKASHGLPGFLTC